MNRRKLLKAAGAAVATGTVAAPAIAQSAPAVRWRLTTCEATYDNYMIRRIRA
jgi:TRAP-type mannitol/chloroaromatic compound transport system substrate-binding protein